MSTLSRGAEDVGGPGSGRTYGKGKGLHVFADGSEITASDELVRVAGSLPYSRPEPTAEN